jgi:hypothetical protein
VEEWIFVGFVLAINWFRQWLSDKGVSAIRKEYTKMSRVRISRTFITSVQMLVGADLRWVLVDWKIVGMMKAY